MKPHFGEWMKKIRNKLGLDQSEMGRWLKLTSYQAVHFMEQKPHRAMRGRTAEAAMELLGYSTEAELDLAWKSGAMPDLEAVKERIERRNRSDTGPKGRGVRIPHLRRLLALSGRDAWDWIEGFDDWFSLESETFQQMLLQSVNRHIDRELAARSGRRTPSQMLNAVDDALIEEVGAPKKSSMLKSSRANKSA